MPTVNLDTSARLDIICRRGDTFDLTVDFNTADLGTDYPSASWKLQVRDSDTNNNTSSDILINVNEAYASPGTLTGFTSSGETLQIRIKSSDMDVDSGLYVYDLQTTVGSAVRTWLHGEFKIVEDITI